MTEDIHIGMLREREVADDDDAGLSLMHAQENERDGKTILDERRRMDALSDLQRYKGCTVMEPGPLVVYERMKLEGSTKRPPPPVPFEPPVILKSRG